MCSVGKEDEAYLDVPASITTTYDTNLHKINIYIANNYATTDTHQILDCIFHSNMEFKSIFRIDFSMSLSRPNTTSISLNISPFYNPNACV